MTTMTFTVLGVPQQKGSTKSFFRYDRKRRRPTRQLVTISDNRKLAQWEECVAFNAIAARNLAGCQDIPFTGPVAVHVYFYLPRPKSISPAQRLHPIVAPDLDKLVRGICDPMSGVLYPDDAFVVSVSAMKRYADDQLTPRAVIRVWEVVSSCD